MRPLGCHLPKTPGRPGFRRHSCCGAPSGCQSDSPWSGRPVRSAGCRARGAAAEHHQHGDNDQRCKTVRAHLSDRRRPRTTRILKPTYYAPGRICAKSTLSRRPGDGNPPTIVPSKRQRTAARRQNVPGRTWLIAFSPEGRFHRLGQSFPRLTAINKWKLVGKTATDVRKILPG